MILPELKIIQEDISDIVNRCHSVKKLEGSSILITGASGMLASYMVHTVIWLNRHVFKRPCEIYAVGRNKKRLEDKFSYAIDSPHINFVLQDISKDLFQSFPRVEYIIHAASPASFKAYSKDPLATIRCNTTITDQLLDWGYRTNIKGYLFFSSGAVYGNTDEDGGPTRESFVGRVDPLTLRSCYTESKRCGETICYNYWKHHGVPARIVRPSHTYGPGINKNDDRVFSAFIYAGLASKPIKIKSDGTAKRTFCYLADANAAFWRVLLDGKDGEAYNVGNDKTEVTILEFAEVVAKLLNVDVALSSEKDIAPKTGVAKRRLLDINKLRALGFELRYDLESGLRRVIYSITGEKYQQGNLK